MDLDATQPQARPSVTHLHHWYTALSNAAYVRTPPAPYQIARTHHGPIATTRRSQGIASLPATLTAVTCGQ
jgi:hypothetical protein